jgi:hypothetical protein
VKQAAFVVLGSLVSLYRWLGREAKEVTLLVGFGLLFAGLVRVDVTLALVVMGALLVRLAWPTPPPPHPRESPHPEPSGSSR